MQKQQVINNPTPVFVHFEHETCCNCGVVFAMSKEFKDRKLEKRGPDNPFFCPAGHRQWYVGETEEQKAKRQRDEALRQVEREKANAAYHEKRATENWKRSERQERRANSYKGHLKRVKNRVGNGVCPCCNRTFQQLARHMAAKHPTYKKSRVNAHDGKGS